MSLEDEFCNRLSNVVDEIKRELEEVVSNYNTIQTTAIPFGLENGLMGSARVKSITDDMVNHIDGCRTAMNDIEELLIERFCIAFEGKAEEFTLCDRTDR